MARGADSRALVDDRVAQRDGDRLRPRVGLELREDVAHVALHGLLGDEELASATSAFDMPSASSWRISRSRFVSRPSRSDVISAGASAGSTNSSPPAMRSIARMIVVCGASFRR